MKNNMKRRYTIALLIVLSIVLSTSTFAYWAGYVNGTSTSVNSTLTIGNGKGVSTSIVLSSNDIGPYGYLVPKGQVENSASDYALEEIPLAYDLVWEESQDVTQLDGETIEGELITNYYVEIIPQNNTVVLNKEIYQSVYDLITITANETNVSSLTLNAETAVTLAYSVTMEEPQNKTEYAMIESSTIIVHFTFIIDFDTYDLALDFTDMDKEDLLGYNAVSTQMDKMYFIEDDSLTQNMAGGSTITLFPITSDEYTLTVNASLTDLLMTNGGYGILFDTYLGDGEVDNDTGVIFQFDRGYADGKMIIRTREYGNERNPIWNASSTEDTFPTKYDDPGWWVASHEITIEVSNYDAETRLAVIYIDGILIGEVMYDDIITDQQVYVGFRGWANSPTNYYDLTVE